MDEAIPLLNKAINDLFEVKSYVTYHQRFYNSRKAFVLILKALDHESVPQWVREEFIGRIRGLMPGMPVDALLKER